MGEKSYHYSPLYYEIEFTIHHISNAFDPLAMVAKIEEHATKDGQTVTQTLGYTDHMSLGKLKDAIDEHLREKTIEDHKEFVKRYAILMNKVLA